MSKYIVYCDFATLKCDFKQFAKFLSSHVDGFQNLNNDIWLIEIDDPEIPFYYDMSDFISDLENAGYADKDSNIIVAKYSELAYRIFGVDESFHID